MKPRATRDTLYENYPPAWTLHAELANVEQGMITQLKARGFSLAQIRRMAKTLESIPGDTESHHARRALFFIGRFHYAWKRGDLAPAVFYAYHAGRSMRSCLVAEDRRLEREVAKYTRTGNYAKRDAAIMKAVEAKLAEHSGNYTLKELYSDLAACIDEMTYPNFAKILHRGKWTELRTEIRQRISFGTKRDSCDFN